MTAHIRFRAFVCSIFVMWLPATRLPAADWPQFRGPNGLGVADTTGLPQVFGPDKNVIWKTALPPGHSSPALTEDRIFVTAYEGDKLLTICLQRERGQVLWRRRAPRPRQQPFHSLHGPATPSPATDGENVYVFFGDFGLLSYDADGEERWRVPLGPFNNTNGSASSPILAEGMVILVCDQDDGSSFMIAVDQQDGRLRWRVERPEFTRGFVTPGVYRPQNGRPQLVVPGSYQVVSYDLATREKLWWVRKIGWQVKCVPIIVGDAIYVNAYGEGIGGAGSTHELPAFEELLAENDANQDGKIAKDEGRHPRLTGDWINADIDNDGFVREHDWKFYIARLKSENSLVAIRPNGRRGDLTDTNVLWRYRKSLPNTPSPLLYKDVIYMVKNGGIVTALDAERGTVLKQARVREAVDDYWASVVAADDKVFLVSQGCAITVLSATGEWDVLATNRLDDECFATPAIADGRIYVRTLKALYSFGKR